MTPLDFEGVQRLIDERQARFVDLKLADLEGQLRHVTIPVEQFTRALIDKGIGFDGSSYGLRKVENSDMVMVPDLATAHVDPFRGEPTVSLFCSIRLAEPGLPPAEQDARAILERARARLRELDIADEIRFAPEYEFYLFRDVDSAVRPSESYFRVATEEALGYNTYHLINPLDRYADFRDRAVRLLLDMGMPVKYHHHETGGHGQQEIEFHPEYAAPAADHALLVKYLLHNLAEQEGLRLTFMPKPLFEEPGNGWHTHQMLLREGKNLFHDPAGYGGLSELALAYVCGLLKHAPALAALTNASTNSYKRLNSGYEAPVAITFGEADRTAAVRIPKWAQGADARIEYRPSDLTGNPYLILAGMLMAGLDGVERNLDPVAEGFGPAESLDPERVHKLPRTFEDALDELEADHAFLCKGGVFPESVIAQWLELKREECASVSIRPHPIEYVLYFD